MQQISTEAQLLNGHQALAKMSPDERKDALLKAHESRQKTLMALARDYQHLGMQAAGLQSELNDVHKRQKETGKQMSEMCGMPIEQGIQLRIPGVAAPTAAQPGNAAEKIFREGEAAAKAGKPESAMPHKSSGQPFWLSGWRSATAATKEIREAAKLPIALKQLIPALEHVGGILPASEKPQTVKTVDAFERPHLVIGWLTGGGGAESVSWVKEGLSHWYLQPLYTKDEWQQLHEKEFGRALMDFDQNKEAQEQRQRGGVDCGRAVKVGKKLYFVGPRREVLVVVAGEEMKPADPKPSGKEAAAGKD